MCRGSKSSGRCHSPRIPVTMVAADAMTIVEVRIEESDDMAKGSGG